MKTQGRCHCTNIAFTLDWRSDPDEIPVRACTCSFCVKHGGVWTSCPGGSLRVTIASPRDVSRYAFGTKTAEFLVCARCGIVPLVTSRIDGHLYAVVSANALEDVDAARLRRASATFDDEDEAARLARRKKGWIADVEIIDAVS